jgi:hypothetical protein
VGALALAGICATLEADARAGLVSGAPARVAAAREAFAFARDELLVLRDAE